MSLLPGTFLSLPGMTPTSNALTLAISILSLLSIHFPCDAQTTPEFSTEDTTEPASTSGTILIRRKIHSPRAPGGRYSLLNNRINRRPRKKNLDREQLLEILGSYYDPDWMSIEEPLALANKDPDRGATYVVGKDNWHHRDMIKQLQASNLTSELSKLGGQRFVEDAMLVKTVEKWLLKKASCPVRYAWEDIGALFWPRYVRRGECSSVPGTCSWPPGMHCVPSATTTLHVLRWQCKVPKGGKGASRPKKNQRREQRGDHWPRKGTHQEGAEQPINLRCSWITVPYPITSDCLCTC